MGFGKNEADFFQTNVCFTIINVGFAITSVSIVIIDVS
jgi:hypothetical protein